MDQLCTHRCREIFVSRRNWSLYMNKRICSHSLREMLPAPRPCAQSSFVSANQCCTAGTCTPPTTRRKPILQAFTSTIRDIDNINSDTVCYVPMLGKGEERSAASRKHTREPSYSWSITSQTFCIWLHFFVEDNHYFWVMWIIAAIICRSEDFLFFQLFLRKSTQRLILWKQMKVFRNDVTKILELK